MRVWTAEARRAQSEAIRRWKPWKGSTGPRTASGKARSSQNARMKPGTTRYCVRFFEESVRAQRLCRKLALEITREKNLQKRTIMKARFHEAHQQFNVLIMMSLQGNVLHSSAGGGGHNSKREVFKPKPMKIKSFPLPRNPANLPLELEIER